MENNRKWLVTLVVFLILLVLGLGGYILLSGEENKYNHKNLEGYYEVIENDRIMNRLLIFDDGSFQLEDTTPHSIYVGSYLIGEDTLTLNYLYVFGGGFPLGIGSTDEVKVLKIESLNTLIEEEVKFVRNDEEKDNELVKLSFDIDKDYITNITDIAQN